ncbi:hypothetical protein MRB53_039007 [Persea americana]|nr:hypothetical protein MRB53_039007 [Persea americana]
MSQSLFSVSIYDTLGPDTTEFIINHAELPTVVASVNHIPTLIKIKPRCPKLKLIISLDPLDDGEMPGYSKAALLNGMAAQYGLQIISLKDVEARGAASSLPLFPPRAEDYCTINYTSGTTGSPKGVLLTHENAVSAVCNSFTAAIQHSDSTMISYLPLAHIYERVGEQTAMAAGAKIGFFHGNVLEIVEDLQMLRPTGFTSVPRLYNRFGASIKAATIEAPRIRGMLSRHVVATKLENLKVETPDAPGATVKHALWDRVWGAKVRKALGLQRSLFMVSGSAPLDPTLHSFLRTVFAQHFFQGYGLTETYAVSMFQLLGDLSTGNCGAIAPSIEACLADVPDMEYLSTDKPFPRGELLLRGYSVSPGYYKNDEETKKAYTKDGWFHTGDICTIDSMGRFKIIDRKKNVLKLAHGEYVSPERIENVYLANCPWMSAAYVHGDSHQPCLVLIGAIMPELFCVFANKVLGTNIVESDMPAIESALQNPKIKAEMMKEFDKVGKVNKFNSFERVKGAILMYEPFTIENDLLTPTLKLKRPQTAKVYRKEIDAMYAEISSVTPVAGIAKL